MSSSVQAILALIGLPVAGNPSQFMFERALEQVGLDCRYLSLEVTPEGLTDAVRGMRAMGFHGGTCADPHKETIGPLLDHLTETARQAGVVNCFVRNETGLLGDNTEGRGLLESLRPRIDPAEKRVVVLGAGRMARAVAVELALAKAAAITVVSRSEASGRALVELLNEKLGVPASLTVWEGEYQVPAETQILTDATALGADGPDAPRPLNLELLAAETVVADVSYNPPRSWLLAQASERGCPTIGGLEIYLQQALLSFRLWTGAEADATVLREAVEEFLEL